MRDYESTIFNSFIESLKSVESITRASIRQAETHMQRIESFAKDRKKCRYYVMELTKALEYYSFVESSLNRFDALIESVEAMATRLNKNEREIFVQKIKGVAKEAKLNNIQFEQEKNVIKELEMLVLKIDLNKIKKVIKR